MPSDEIDKASLEALGIQLLGKLGNPEVTLLDDPRLDPRIATALIEASMTFPAQQPNVHGNMTYEDAVDFTMYMHSLMASMSEVIERTMPDFESIESYELPIRGDGSHKIDLLIDRPKDAHFRMPCIVHLHGGGMIFDTARNASNVRWRKSLAELNAVVIGVEFRNEGLSEGHQPFPAGLDDCAAAVRWVHENRDELQISSIIVIGESGGGNLAISTALKGNAEGWGDTIDGVYAMAPMLYGFYDAPPEGLLSWHENLGLMGDHATVRAMRLVYDPEQAFKDNPLCNPLFAPSDLLNGLPPHIIRNYELDLIRDEGVVYAKRLRAAGVEATSQIVNGAHHVPEIAMPDAIPELTRDTLSSIAAFAYHCAR